MCLGAGLCPVIAGKVEQRQEGTTMTRRSRPLWDLDEFQALLRRRIEEGWTFEKIEPMSSD